MTESQYQAKVIKKLEDMFPGCSIMKTDPAYRQGYPDLVILWHKFWAALEIKTSAGAHRQPNQRYHVTKLNDMSFAAFIYPENEREVLRALQQAFKSAGRTRVLES
jgi:hypothetical protein